MGRVTKVDEQQIRTYTDEQLASLIQQGSAEAFAELTARYLHLIRAKAAPFRCTFLDSDDLSQEGLLGLYQAACSFLPARGAGFATYAGACVQNHILMAYRKAMSQKRQPPNGFVPLDEEEKALAANENDPEALLLSQERLQGVLNSLQELLSPLEREALSSYIGGGSYAQIAQQLGISPKAVGNALHRARSKLKKL